MKKNHTIDDYDVGQLLGRGGFASVYRVRERETGILYALKIMQKESIIKNNMKNRVINEIRIQSELVYDGIVHFYCHFEDEECVYMVLELCEGGNLYRYLKVNGPLCEREALAVIKQLLLSLEYMHANGVVHRDLKLSNVLLVQNGSSKNNYNSNGCKAISSNKNNDNGSNSSSNENSLKIKLCDFGLAVQVQHPDEVGEESRRAW